MNKLVIFIILLIITQSCNYKVVNTKDAEKTIQMALEIGYFEGQVDALNNDVRIQLNSDSCYVWTKSPWNNNDIPIYTPSVLDSKSAIYNK